MDTDDFDLDLNFSKLMLKKEIIIRSETKERLPEWLGELVHLEILRVRCPRLCEMPSSLGRLAALKTLDLRKNIDLKKLPVALGAMASIKRIDVQDCPSLHTPPTHIVKMGTDAMLQFLRDLAKGEAPSHLIKLVLLGDQRAGKSSLADSLVLGRPATRADNDRTVGIEVRRWGLGGQSPLVANIYDAAGQRIYRATHGFFMSPGALFLHVVRCDMPEDAAVAALLEWVAAVQQEAPGAVMGVVWTHIDCVDEATVMQTQVLGRVHTEIEQQVLAVDEALRQLENDFMQDFSAHQQTDLYAKWARTREHRDTALSSLDQHVMTGCLAREVVGKVEEKKERRKRKKDAIDLKEMVDALAKLKTLHNELQQMEQQMAAAKPDKDWTPLAEQLQRLRQQRVQRPRILCSHSVSSHTGQGLRELRRALAALMEDTRLFPHVGAKVPLNYSMLERLAQEGRADASGGAEHDNIATEADRSDWEHAVTQHVAERARVGLREVCSQACVSLGALEEVAAEVGMDKAEVHSALLFLHATGSVLHYGKDTRRGSHALQGTVFMQPQFIIDAIKYIIREPNATDVNDEIRKMDTLIRVNADDAEALDRFLGTEETHGSSGVLTRQLLIRHLWRDIDPTHRDRLLDLMTAFKLLRPLADTKTFLVPAMLPRQKLPEEYVTPDWWRPSKAGAAAVMHVEHVARPAEMRIMYKVLGGRLPFGFFSELQVRLSQPDKRGDKELHFAPEAAVVDRITGSVLSAAYKCGGAAPANGSFCHGRSRGRGRRASLKKSLWLQIAFVSWDGPSCRRSRAPRIGASFGW